MRLVYSINSSTETDYIKFYYYVPQASFNMEDGERFLVFNAKI